MAGEDVVKDKTEVEEDESARAAASAMTPDRLRAED